MRCTKKTMHELSQPNMKHKHQQMDDTKGIEDEDKDNDFITVVTCSMMTMTRMVVMVVVIIIFYKLKLLFCATEYTHFIN